MAANHLRRVAAAASAPALSRRPQPPSPILRLTLSSSAPEDKPATAEGAAPRKGEAGKETDAAEDGDTGATNEDAEEEEGDGGGVHVNKAKGEIGGPHGPEPTRYGDWERGGRCSDF